MWGHGQSCNTFRAAAKRDGHRRSPISISHWPCLEPPCAGTRRVLQLGPSTACETILISAQRALVASKRPKGPLGEARCAREVFLVAADPPVTRPNILPARSRRYASFASNHAGAGTPDGAPTEARLETSQVPLIASQLGRYGPAAWADAEVGIGTNSMPGKRDTHCLIRAARVRRQGHPRARY
jgi:hypothetical protein